MITEYESAVIKIDGKVVGRLLEMPTPETGTSVMRRGEIWLDEWNGRAAGAVCEVYKFKFKGLQQVEGVTYAECLLAQYAISEENTYSADVTVLINTHASRKDANQ